MPIRRVSYKFCIKISKLSIVIRRKPVYFSESKVVIQNIKACAKDRLVFLNISVLVIGKIEDCRCWDH